MSEARWVKLDVGQFEIKEMQCVKCINRILNPLVCNKYPERKPLEVLKCKGECLKFKVEE